MNIEISDKELRLLCEALNEYHLYQNYEELAKLLLKLENKLVKTNLMPSYIGCA